MMTANMRTFRMATACLFAAAGLTPALAQEINVNTGIVRISDSKPVPAGATPGQHQGSPDAHVGHFHGDCPHCQAGGKGKKFCERYCTHSPDHGYSIPGKWPIHRRGVQYQTLFPQQYYSVHTGAPYAVAAPQIYQPTDTTQLGYYYQHVPFWQPQPNMLPARPVPAQWHTYAPVVYASQFGRGYTKGGSGFHDGAVIYETTPTQNGGTPTDLQPVPENDATMPPKPLMESSVPLPMQRVEYRP